MPESATFPSPAVSVCIPAYQAEKHLAATLDSVGAQTFRDWEVIVTEDGSRDRTEEIVRAFAAKARQRVRYIRHEVNRGLPATRNTGLAAAAAPVLALLDADDLWTPDHLATCLASLGDPAAPAAVWSPCAIFDDATGDVVGRRHLDPEDRDRVPEALHAGRFVAQPSGVLFTRAVPDRIGVFDPGLPICNDVDYWIRILRAGLPFRCTDRSTLRYRKHPAAMSRRSAELTAELGRVYFKHRAWAMVPAAARRARVRRLFLCAARMDAGRPLRRARPLRALRALFNALALPLFIR
jgi:glycosyltransferase involved in cell wall biosynthesis